MAVWESYQQTRQAEDVEDEIYIVSPVDAPCASMSKTIRATGKLHQWSTDSLNAPAKNAQVEGAVAPDDVSNAIVELSNPTQIMSKSAEISGTLESVEKYGRDSEMAYQLELRYGELANDEEFAILGSGRQTAVAGDASTAREMACIYAQIGDGTKEDATSITTVPELETLLLAAHEATYTLGGNPSYLFTPPALANHISEMAFSAGRQRDINNEKKLVNCIDLFVSNFGELDVVLDRNQDDTTFLLLDFNYLATPVLRPTADWPIAKTGDKDQRQILRESTYAVLTPDAHAWVDAIPASLTNA